MFVMFLICYSHAMLLLSFSVPGSPQDAYKLIVVAILSL